MPDATTSTERTKRHERWTFKGTLNADGAPTEFFIGIPARNLTAEDVVTLTDDDYALVEASPLYEKGKDSTVKTEKADTAKAPETAKGKGSGNDTANAPAPA